MSAEAVALSITVASVAILMWWMVCMHRAASQRMIIRERIEEAARYRAALMLRLHEVRPSDHVAVLFFGANPIDIYHGEIRALFPSGRIC